jgi:hypothetical protein
LSLSFIIVFQSDDVILAEIIAELDFDEGEVLVGGVAEAVVGFGWDMDMLARFELELTFAADDVGDALDNDPMLAAARVALKTQASARLHFESFNFVACALFKDFIPPPGSLVSFASHYTFLLKFVYIQAELNRSPIR